MMTAKTIQIVGVVATAVGFGAQALSGWVDTKKLDLVVERKVAEALSKMR